MTEVFSGSYPIESRGGEIERLHIQSAAMVPDTEADAPTRAVALWNESATYAALNRFGDSSVPRGKNRQPARHGFEHGIWNALLISVLSGLARMQENVRPVIQRPQLLLRDKADKRDGWLDL